VSSFSAQSSGSCAISRCAPIDRTADARTWPEAAGTRGGRSRAPRRPASRLAWAPSPQPEVVQRRTPNARQQWPFVARQKEAAPVPFGSERAW
jgi:hypothetical protein